MVSKATNTLILSGIRVEKLDEASFISQLQQEIINIIPNTDTIQFIILRSFRRIIIIFNNLGSSIKLYDHFKTQHKKEFTTGYSLNNYTDDINDNYLQLPNNSRMFLISPPASPPADFDYDQTEEEPNKLQIYTHEELQEIFLKNNKELRDILESNQKNTNHSNARNEDGKALNSLNDFEKEIILNDSDSVNQPKIILHPINGENDHLIGKAIQSFKTSLPPKSVFDGLSDNEYDDEDYD